MLKIIFNSIFVGFGILLLTCGSINQPTQVPNIIKPNSEQSFPLKIGYYWEFAAVGRVNNIKLKVISDSLISGNKYFLLQFIYNNSSISSELIRVDNQGNVRKYQNGSDIIWFDFSKNNNETYFSPSLYNDTVNYNVLVRKYFTVIGENQSFDSSTYFYFDIPSYVDEEIEYFISPGYGIVKIDASQWYASVLVNAKLN